MSRAAPLARKPLRACATFLRSALRAQRLGSCLLGSAASLCGYYSLASSLAPTGVQNARFVWFAHRVLLVIVPIFGLLLNYYENCLISYVVEVLFFKVGSRTRDFMSEMCIYEYYPRDTVSGVAFFGSFFPLTNVVCDGPSLFSRHGREGFGRDRLRGSSIAMRSPRRSPGCRSGGLRLDRGGAL